MTFENFPKPAKDSDSYINELQKKTLELEAKNIKVENMPHNSTRDIEIANMDILNTELDRLEQITSLSDKSILEEYEKLTRKTAIQGIEKLLKELETSSIDTQTIQEIKNELNTSNFDDFLIKIKNFIPSKLLLATACVLILSTSISSNDIHASQISSIHTTTNQEMQNSEISDAEFLEKTDHIMNTANQKAVEAIQNIDGFIKKLAQKKVMDELADHRQEILQCINDDMQTIPQLNDNALELFNIYKDAIVKVDKLKNPKASEEVRLIVAQKINLIATKDYDRIQKEMT